MATAATEQGTKRLNLALPDKLFNELQQLAESQDTSVTELLRRFIKLGLLAIKLQDEPEDGLIMRKGGRDQKVHLL